MRRALGVLGCALAAVVSAAHSDEIPDPLDPAEVEQANRLRDDLAAEPIRLDGADDRLRDVPGMDDSLAAALATNPRTPVPRFLRPYLAIDGERRVDGRVRAGLRDPGMTDRFRRSSTSARVRFVANGWSGGIVTDRDAGEPGVADYAGGALGWRSRNGDHAVAFGHVRAHVGTGMLSSRTAGGWLSGDLVRPREPSVGTTLAAEESGALIGAAGYARGGSWDALLLVARPRWDATIDSTAGVATQLRTDGTHVTDYQRECRDALDEKHVLGRAGWRVGRNDGSSVAFGATVAGSDFTRPLRIALVRTAPRSEFRWLGIDTRATRGPVAGWGEIVREGVGAIGAAGAIAYRKRPVGGKIAGWTYAPDLILPHGGGWSARSELMDERGILAAIDVRADGYRGSATLTRWRQAHASRTDSLPRNGEREEITVARDLGERADLLLRWRRTATRTPALGSAGERTRRDLRADFTYVIGGWRTRARADVIDAASDGRGYLAAATVSRADRIGLQIAAFRSASYDAAPYLYELRAPDYGYSRALVGTGLAGTARAGGTIGAFGWSISLSGAFGSDGFSDTSVVAQIDARVPAIPRSGR